MRTGLWVRILGLCPGWTSSSGPWTQQHSWSDPSPCKPQWIVHWFSNNSGNKPWLPYTVLSFTKQTELECWWLRGANNNKQAKIMSRWNKVHALHEPRGTTITCCYRHLKIFGFLFIKRLFKNSTFWDIYINKLKSDKNNYQIGFSILRPHFTSFYLETRSDAFGNDRLAFGCSRRITTRFTAFADAVDSLSRVVHALSK